MSLPYVVACCPAYKRDWVLPRWRAAINAAGQVAGQPRDRSVVLLDTAGGERVATDAVARYDIAHLAEIRNDLLRYVLLRHPRATHVWSCDSDVLPNADVLRRLLDAHLPIVAAVVRNSPMARVYNYFCGLDIDGVPVRDGSEAGKLTANSHTPFAVTMTGACCLYERGVFERGVQWAAHPRGEDVGLAILARRLGVGMYVHPLAHTRHLQPDGSEWTINKEETVLCIGE